MEQQSSSGVKGAALLGGVNALHTSFPADAQAEYKLQVSLILQRLAELRDRGWCRRGPAAGPSEQQQPMATGAVSSAAKASTQPHPGEKHSKDPHSHFSQPQQRSGTVENHLHASDISNYEQSEKLSSIKDTNRKDVNSSIIALMSEDPPSLSVIMNKSSCIQDESSIDLELQTPKLKSPKGKGIGKRSKKVTTLPLNNNSPLNLFSDFQNKSDQKEHVDSVDETHDILELAGPLNCSTPNVKQCWKKTQSVQVI